jgi:hypothetical protein
MPHPRLQGATIAVPKASNPTVYPTATGHSDQCSYHCDQYDWECDCGHTNKATNAWAMREMRAAQDMTPRLCQSYVLGYLEERSKVSSRHKLPTRDEISQISFGFFTPAQILVALDDLEGSGRVKRVGPYYGTTIPEVM